MSDNLTVITNNVPRSILDGCQLTEKEQAEFDYPDWSAIAEGSDSASFFRYRGEIYDLAEFMTTSGMPQFSPLAKWHGYHSDTFFSGIVVRYAEDCDYVIVGRFYS